jgi:RHS repeat-associated protein
MKNGTTNYYIYGAGLLYEIDETASTTNTAFYHFDCRGSTVTLTDGYGNPTDLIEYGPYGTMTYHAGTNTTPFLYNGQFGVQTDPNGLLYMRARYYNPYISRFINADPSGFGGGLNFYQFASGNPISYWDPTGLCAGGTPADTQNPFNLNFNPSQYTQPCIMCHGSSAFGFNGNINSFSGLSAIPGSGANAQQGYATEAFIAQTVTPFIAGPAGGLIADALDAGAITAATDATITAAAGGATSATTINLAEGEAALVLTQNGNLVAQQPVGSMLSHAEFASQYGALASDGSLAPGYWVGTIGKVNGQVVAMNSMTFYGNQLPNYNATIALGSAFH